MADFKQVLKSKKKIVWPGIKKHLELPLNFTGQRKVSDKYSDFFRFHKRIVADYLERQGKNIRPLFVLLIIDFILRRDH